jgi:hypothetical protein
MRRDQDVVGDGDHQTDTTTETDELAALRQYLTAYRPECISAETWSPVSGTAAELVLRAGAPRRQRVANDIVVVAQVVAHLVERGRTISLDEILTDTTLASFDNAQRSSSATREAKRAVHRRLQAAHRGLPWRAARRGDGERVESMVGPEIVDAVHRVLDAASQAAERGDADAAAFARAVAAYRSARGITRDLNSVDYAAVTTSEWSSARRFADRFELRLTKPILKAVVTHEVLVQARPLQALTEQHALTRRDLDLALTHIRAAETGPDVTARALLRG